MQLQEMRRAAGLTREQVKDRLGMSVSTVSRLETGRTGVRLTDLRALLDLYAITDAELREGLEGLSREGRQQGWWSRHASILSTTYSTYIGLEEAATRLLAYESSVIPGLLQTESYATALFQHAKETADVVQQRVRVRMQRQERLEHGGDDRPPLKLWAILDESAIRREIGGPDVMVSQLKRLAEAGAQPNVTLQVLPFSAGSHPSTAGSFSVIELPETDGHIVYIEGLAGDIYVDGTDVTRYTMAFDELRAAALSPNASTDLVERALADIQARRS